jgi:hypothetical protein
MPCERGVPSAAIIVVIFISPIWVRIFTHDCTRSPAGQGWLWTIPVSRQRVSTE